MGNQSTGLQENIASFLCYLFGWVTGLIFYFIEPNNRTVRFHALQSILLCVAMIPIYIVLMIVLAIFAAMNVPIVAAILMPVFVICFFILWIMLMVKAYQGKRLKLPLIGNMAEKWSSR